MKTNKPFSLTARIKSFHYAFAGIRQFFASEHNAWIHLFATVIVIVLAFIIPISSLEAVSLVIVIGLVWVTELFNTAVERLVDFVSIEKSPVIKIIKDISAAAVLVAAVIAVITGCWIFIPKL
jgi:diacylglycerol kinase (ATP)